MLYGLPPQQEVVTGVILEVSIPPVLRAMAAFTMSAISSGESQGLDLPHLSEEGLYPWVYQALYNQGDPPILSYALSIKLPPPPPSVVSHPMGDANPP